jgi:outer membrane protein TolC
MRLDTVRSAPPFAFKPAVLATRLAKPALALTLATLLSACAISPQPIGMEERRAALNAERAALTRKQEPVQGAVSLEEALARAIKYNLDFRIKQMEAALAQGQLDIANFELLPKLTAAAGYSNRDNELASSSRSVITGRQSLEPSTSTDRDRNTADLSFSWNLLDFGVSYYQAQQQADRALVAQERRRKTLHLIMQQVRQAWWQAAGAQQLESKIGPVLEQARSALANSRRIESERLAAPLDSLNYQRQLLDIIRQLEVINDELSQAKPRLAALMNLEPGKPYQLAAPGNLAPPEIRIALDKMEETALLNRPELMEARYNERIGRLEARKAIARLFPGVQFELGAHHDSNSFLVNNDWRDAGLRVSWNLFNLLNAGRIRKSAELQEEIAHDQKLALSMAVLTQTQVAYREYLGRKRQFELSADLDGVEQKILQHTRNAARSDAQGKLQEIRAAAGALMSELRRYQSYGALQGAYGQMLATLGVDPLPEQLPADDLNSIQRAIQQTQTRWTQEIAAAQGAS